VKVFNLRKQVVLRRLDDELRELRVVPSRLSYILRRCVPATASTPSTREAGAEYDGLVAMVERRRETLNRRRERVLAMQP
jgi:hypothetical protein